MSLSCLLMHVSSERLDVLDVSGRQDAMTEVEDVARTAGGALEYFVGRREDASEWSEEERGVEIALNRPVGPDARPRLVERRAPVSADDVAAALPQLAQNRSGADAEMNRGDARPALCCRAGAAGGEAIEDLPDMGQDELSIVGRVQRADPRIEHLHRIDTGTKLCRKIVDRGATQRHCENYQQAPQFLVPLEERAFGALGQESLVKFRWVGTCTSVGRRVTNSSR